MRYLVLFLRVEKEREKRYGKRQPQVLTLITTVAQSTSDRGEGLKILSMLLPCIGARILVASEREPEESFHPIPRGTIVCRALRLQRRM
jgi:hypothetical protein